MAAPNYITDVSGPTPNYLLGADNHNLGNDSTSWFDPTTWPDKVGNAGKFFAVSALSGADSVYNSAVTVGNWLGAEASLSDTSQWITALDADLGQYYSQNRQAADLAGFIGTAFVPGIGGIKALNAGQNALRAATKAGSIGKNLSQFTGILAPSTETYVKLAGAEIKSQQAVFSSLNKSTLQALGSGVWQNALEGAAFETFVQATMFKSPILETQDNWDIAKNILTGAALGGVIGGAFEGARTLRGIKNERLAEDYALKPFNSREVVQEATSPADRIILALENRDMTAVPYIPPLPASASVAEQELRAAQLANAQAAVAKKSASINNTVREALHEMNVGANPELINLVADSLQGIGHIDALKNLAGAEEITRVLNTTKMEREAAKNLTPGVQSRYVKLQGENAGEVSFDLPPVLSVADRVALKSGQTLQDAINAEVKSKGFTHKLLWDPLSKASKLSWRDAELRYIWADQLTKLPENALIHGNDIPLLERFLKDGNVDLRIQVGKTEFKPSTPQELREFIISRKDALSNDLMLKRIDKLDPESDSIETITAAIGKTLNMRVNWLEGTREVVDPSKGYFAWQTLGEETAALRKAKGLTPIDTPSYYQPQLAKINYKIPDPLNPNASSFVTDAMVHIKQQQKLFQEQADRVVAKQSGTDLYNRMAELSDVDLARTNSYGAGSGMLSSAQSRYGSPESTVQYLGGVSKDLTGKIKQGVDDTLQGPLYHVSQNKEAAIEVATVNQQLSRTSEHYVFDREDLLGLGENTLVPKKYIDAAKKGGEDFSTDDLAAISLQPGAPEYIKFQTWEAAELFNAHASLTAQRTSNAMERNTAYGKIDQKSADIVRPYRHAIKDYPHFALVKDPSVTGAGHTTMLFANTPKELEALIAKTNRDFPEFQVLTKQDTAEYYRAHQEYEYSRGLNENYIDSSLKSRGIFSNFYTETDPNKIVDTILQYHYRSAEVEASEIMRLKFNSQFNWLENQANAYSALESSKFGGGKIGTIQQNEKNPYISYIKTALNLSSTPTSNPWWSLNKWLDNSVSALVGRVRNSFDKANSPGELEEVKTLLSKYGSQTAYNLQAADLALINHTAPKAELSKFVRSANAIMSRFTLGLDPLNTLNNAIGANVLRGTELAQVTRAINQGNEEIAGRLAQIGKVAIPGVDDTILSPTKLFANSLRRFADPVTRKQLLAEYRDAGFIRDRLEQFWSMADDLTLRGTETANELTGRINSAFSRAKKLADAGERLTGNTYAEEFNRFISADVARQITDLAEAGGIMSRSESLTYIQTFVNRVEGNTFASQRPGLFQGPIGQAIGLFQSYQFNLMQQMFRYVAEGEKKDLGMLLGLQGTFYGLQGEPGFKFLNDHIVGTLSGNQQHRDLYDATRGIVGKTAGDWLLYGTASNMLQTNLYSRGDINPRQLSIIPTSLNEVPFVGGMSKVFGSLYEAAQKIGNGAPVWESIRQGIEHNGVSRPLAGLAQVATSLKTGNEVFSTSSKGTIIGSNDLLSLASLSRLAGGRPLDEAIQNDTMFSVHQYEAVDRAKKNLLAESVKTAVIKGNIPDEESVNQFAAKYAELGGKQGSFAKYMMEQYTKANTSQAQILFQKLNHPMSYKIQALMGGEEY